MSINAPIDLDALQDKIVADIKAQFPDLQTVEFYREEEREGLPLPAVILDLCEFETVSDNDVGTGQLPVMARFEAEIIFGFRVANVKREVRKFSAALAAWLYKRRWPGHVCDAAEVVGCYPDDFDPKMDKYVVWRVEWTQGLYLGNSVWDNNGKIPLTRLSVSINGGPPVDDWIPQPLPVTNCDGWGKANEP
ncbi:hypothetical protein AB4Y36_10280 [Paraburkholderia sp. BR10936]|uniref:hypothetical protein n=1 Tax=Paraburkholderia sp. BR10936 TaxID=3236993 RepID=UPI0034D2FE90